MIVKGLIKTIDFTDNSCTVRLPLFETAASQGEVVLPATILIQPGMYNGYAEGDVVFVDFENDTLSRPIVIGKLYLGAGRESEIPPHAALAVSNLKVTKSATLPIDTRIVIEELGDTVPVENGITSYKSIADIVKAIYKAETDMGQVTHDQAEMVSKITVEYLSRGVDAGKPASDDPLWSTTTPAYKDGFSIWQKTTCYNHRGQILNVEIICLTAVSSSAVYRLRCSTRMHAGPNQLDTVQVVAMVKIGTSLEVEDESAVLSYRWSSGSTGASETEIEAGSSFSLTPAQMQAKNLVITAKHQGVVYDSETIIYAPLNTPIVVLSNEVDAIVYEADGVTAISEPVSSKATLYLNGDVLPATYKWELTDCYADENSTVTSVDGDTVTVRQVSPRTRSGTARCTATATQDGSFKGKTYSKDFTIAQTRIGENATSFWLSSSCTVHTGQKHGKNIVVSAMKKIGIAPEEPDTAAYIWWKYKNAVDDSATTGVNESHWKLAAARHRLNFVFPHEVIDDDIMLLATHNAAFNPNATGVDLLTSVDIYEREEIPFSPLNTPILNLTNDMGAFVCKSDGTKVNEADTVSTEAELWLNGSKLTSGVTYSWSLTNCLTPTNETGNNAVTTAELTIKTITENTATAICTATYKGESYSKTFKVVKQIQGQSLYTIDIYNDFVTIPTDETGEILTAVKSSLTNLTTHSIACYYGGEPVTIADYVTTTPTTADELFRIKYVATNVTLAPSSAVVAPSFAITDLLAEEGSITYELYQGNIKLASAKFEATKLRQGVSATSYWIDYTARVHKGTNQQSDISATAWEKFGSLEATKDLNRYIRYGWRQTDGSFGDFSSPVVSTATVPANNFRNADLIFELGTGDGDDFEATDTEIISYSPAETPILDLTNDNATLAYKPTGVKLDSSSSVSSIASVYLNGEIITEGVSYEWSPTNGASITDIKNGDTLIGKQITVSNLFATTTDFKCTAVINNQKLFKNEVRLEKVFTVTKQVQGEYGITYWLNVSAGMHVGQNQQESITITAMQKVGTEELEDIDESATLFYSYDGYDWTAADESSSYTLTILPDTDKDLLIKAEHSGKEYDRETITYSPLNTPALDLDNDTATILYSADGTTLLGAPVESTATLYLNGDPLAANYSWFLVNCSTEALSSVTTADGQTITVAALSANSARAVCTATVTAAGPFNGKQYTKAFTISKVKKGDNAVSYSIVMDQQSLVIDPANPAVSSVKLTGTCYVHNGSSVQPFGGANYDYQVDDRGYSSATADENGKIEFTVEDVTAQVEVRLLVDYQVVDKEIIKTISAGVSIVSQTTFYTLVHPDFGAGSLKTPESDQDLNVQTTDNSDLTSSGQAIGQWSTTPPAHTSDTNGWKYWTTIRTEFSNSLEGHYSVPIINEELSSIYALAQGKSTNYYSPTDPSWSYTINEGDCWFDTSEQNTGKTALKQWHNGSWVDVGDEIVAKKVTAEYINTLKLTASSIKVLDSSDANITLFEADGLSGEHKVSIGGFNVQHDTLISGDDGRYGKENADWGDDLNNRIVLSGGSQDVFYVDIISADEINNTPWANSSWYKVYDPSPFTQTIGLTTTRCDGKKVYDVSEYKVTNNLKSGNHFYAITKLRFRKTVENFDVYLNHPNADSSAVRNDYLIASQPSAGIIPNSYTNDASVLLGHDQGDGSIYATKITYPKIEAGEWIYIVYVHGSNVHNADQFGTFYIPAINLRLSIGDNFQVMADGTVYAKNLYLLNDATNDTTDSLESNASGRLEAAEAKIDEIETVKLAALEASIGSINTNKIEVKNTAKTKTIFKADGITTGLADDARVQIGGFTVGDSTIKSTNDNLQLKSDGNIIAKSGDIGGFTLTATSIASGDGNLQLNSAGNIVAKAGDIGGFEINPSGKKEGLYSDYLYLNSEQVYFPVQSYLNLNDKVKIYSATPTGGSQTSYISTVNNTDFIIQNQSGAGIKFSKDSSTTNVDVKLTVEITGNDLKYENKTYTNTWGVTNGSGQANWLYSLYVDLTISLSQLLPHPVDGTLVLNFTRSSYSPHEPAEYQKFRGGTFSGVKFTVPAYSTTATARIKLYDTATSSFGLTLASINGTDVGGVKKATISIAKYSNKNNSVYSLGHFLPNGTGCSLGSDSKVWGSLHIQAATQYNSDSRLKNSVQSLSPELDTLYDAIKPVSYKFNDGTSDRRHFGFIAQDLQQSLASLNINTKDFAPLCIPQNEDEFMSVRYTEFIPLNTDQIQKLKKRVADQEVRIQELERAIKELKT